MRTRKALRCILIGLGLGLAATGTAFEPGTERVCEPSADGQSFDCRDKATGELAEPAKTEVRKAAPVPAPVAAPAAAPDPAPATGAAAPARPAPAASKLPNYLRQSPAAETAVPAEPRAPSGNPQPAPTSGAQSASAPESAPDSGAAAARKPIEPSTPAPAQAAAEAPSAPDSPPASALPQSPAPAAAVPRAAAREATPPAAAPMPAAATQDSTVAPMPRQDLPGAAEFSRLPAGHYTLVLASVRDPSTLDALVTDMGGTPGRLYLLKLGMPDGDWYSLCWSEFDDLDAARAARSTLPADAAITSGWPRRIGLLQSEIAR